MREARTVGFAALVLFLAGCGSQAWLYHHPQGWDQIVSTCPPWITAATCQSLPAVQMTDETTAREAWQYEARVKMRALAGWSYGRMPIDVTIVGGRDECERIRGLDAAAGTPTEACKGPVYFKTAN